MSSANASEIELDSRARPRRRFSAVPQKRSTKFWGLLPFGETGASSLPPFGVVLLVAAVFPGAPLRAQDPVGDPSYLHNPGEDGNYDAELGEFAQDLGGHIPLAAFDKATHPYYYSGLLDDVLENFGDIAGLESAISAGNSSNPIFLHTLDPTDANTVVQLQQGSPYAFDPWWAESGSPNYIEGWNYLINGGYVQILRKAGATKTPVDVLINTRATHGSDFSTVGFLPPNDGTSESIFGVEPDWTDSSTNLLQIEQAIEAEDLVVLVHENFSESFWIQLQRNQEAEYFLRNYFVDELSLDPEDIGHVIANGASWGAQASGMFAIAQPGLYDSVSWAGSGDPAGVILGDWGDLVSHMRAATGNFGPQPYLSSGKSMLYQIVDLLGIRFDNPLYGKPGWDISFLSWLHREDLSNSAERLNVPLYGFVGSEDHIGNYHWESSFVGNSNYHIRYLKNVAHDPYLNLEPGKNEWFYTDDAEWSTAAGAASDHSIRVLVPDSNPPYNVYPDPYSHTLRHDHCSGPCPLDTGFLTSLDLQEDLPVDTVGQGVWIGAGDNMHFDDLDEDGVDEVYFGNYDGYFHVLELDEQDADGPFLVDEWKSRLLGPGLFAMDVEGNVFLGDWKGQVHKINSTATDTYTDSLLASAADSGLEDKLYPAPLSIVSRKNFAPNEHFSGKEVLVLNRYYDWVLLDEDGNHIQTLRRDIAAFGPGHGAAVKKLTNTDTDPEWEYLVPSLAGHLWYIDWDDTQLTNEELILEELIGFTDRALYRVVPVDEDADDEPEMLLLFGRNDTLSPPNRVMIYDFSSGEIEYDVSAPVSFAGQIEGGNGVAFAWIQKPDSTNNPGVWSFVLGAGSAIQMFVFDSGLQGNDPVSITPSISFGEGVVDPLGMFTSGNQETFSSCVTSLAYSEDTGYLAVATSNGRIFLLVEDEGDSGLAFARDSSKADSNVPFGQDPMPWYSNRTLAHDFATDFVKDPSSGSYFLYVAEFAQPFREYTSLPGTLADSKNVYRVASYELDPSLFGSLGNYFTEFVTGVQNRTGLGALASMNRFFRYRDYDGQGIQPYVLAETGAILVEEGNPPVVRQFCNRMLGEDVFDGTGQGFASSFAAVDAPATGGYLFEAIDPDITVQDYTVLTSENPGDFVVPVPDTPGIHVNSQNSSFWWYPRVGSNVLEGQIANPQQGVWGWNGGTSMDLADLPDPASPSNDVPHLVTGTIGGFVYGVLPGERDEQNNKTYAKLSYASPDLGWFIVGMDTGDVDDDGVCEVVVGSFVDTGTFDDWKTGDLSTNRGKLTILRPNPSTGEFDVVAELTGDNQAGLDDGEGITSGVFGVKIDDVDGDDQPDIWCTDGVGHVYLFQLVNGTWTLRYRSKDLGAYPGLYNQILPVKGPVGYPDAGITRKLYLVSPGYLMGFDVDVSKL